MSFVRPQTGYLPDRRPNWLCSIGAADDQDGGSVKRLVRSLRLVRIDWIAVLAARIALLGVLAVPRGLTSLFSNPLAPLCMAGWLVCDLALICSIFIPPFERIAPNRRYAAAAIITGLGAGIHAASAATLLGNSPVALAAATLGPALLAQAAFGRLRILGLPMGLGTALGLGLGLGFSATSLITMLPCLTWSGGLMLLALRDHRTAARDIAEAANNAGALSGEQAISLLHDFERAGRGWFWETDRSGNITYLSLTLAAQLGRKAPELIGRPFTSIVAGASTGAGTEDQRTLGFHFSARTAFSDITVRAAVDREERWWSISGQPVVTPYGQFLGFRGSGADLTEMRRSQAEVARLASVDSLTGLANRAQMMVALEQALNAQRGLIGDCALFLLDLDRFKEVNDTMGHPAGDALLRQVAQRLMRIVGTQGKVGRIGGDEFQVVLPGQIEVMALAKLADQIIFSLSEPYQIEGSQVIIGVSIGVALAPADGTNSETLIRNADLALYTAKGEGRGQFRFFVPAMHAEAEDRRQLENELRAAISTGGLHLEYQPVVCAASERITGFETLIRWNHPTRGPISPAAFIPIAEEAGLIGSIGEWVLRTACVDALHWPEGTRVAVNVSPIQFANPAMPNIVMSALVNAGLPASRLELEITESVFLSDRNNTDTMFAQLKNLGVRLALDDFGTGYSALGYLKTAPFDKIKIDQSFVRGAAIKGSRNAAIVKSIVNLAEALGMETTAEGAETLDELELIRSLGCSHVQGYVYGRPMSHAASLALMEAHEGKAVASGHKASRAARKTMLRTVTLIHGANRYTARVRNVSSSGALIEGLIGVPPGTVFKVAFDDHFIVGGTVRWSADDRMGVEFEDAVNVEAVRTAGRKQESVPIEPSYRTERKAAG